MNYDDGAAAVRLCLDAMWQQEQQAELKRRAKCLPQEEEPTECLIHGRIGVDGKCPRC